MNLNRYQLRDSKNLEAFHFINIGPKGRIRKLIYFTLTNYDGPYNLCFGDEDPQTGKMDDMIVSDNGDGEQVLATVVAAVYAFTDKHPEAWVSATGSTNARTRLYRMGISKYFEKASADFYILGFLNSAWEPFVIGKDYEAFVVRRK